MLPNKLAFVDLETTGGSISRDRIIDIGILRIENNKLVKSYETLVNPSTYLPPEIQELTGISASQLEGAPSFYEIRKDILKVLEGCIFVAHNVRFDYGFLKNEFSRFDISFSSKHFCTVKLSRALFPNFSHHNLDSIIERFNLKVKRRHRAYDDAKAIWTFFQKSQKAVSKDIFEQALNKALKKPSIPIKLSQEILEALSETPGVYIFYGSNNSILYIGKSINIKDRVLSHFSSDYSSSKEMTIAQQIERIETIPTEGELGALLKEASLIKKMQPLYNRKLRYSREMVILKKVLKGNYLTAELTTADNIDVNSLDGLISVFRNKKSAKDFLINIAKEYNLCEKLLGTDIVNTACFGYRLGTCQGACVGKELPQKYNLKFLNAFIKYKLHPWPFQGPIIIKEKNEGFLMDKWCYLGIVDKHGKLEDKPEYNFDLDTYKILVRFLLNNKNSKTINTIQADSLGFSENLILTP